jgi:hypothetical protein
MNMDICNGSSACDTHLRILFSTVTDKNLNVSNMRQGLHNNQADFNIKEVAHRPYHRSHLSTK